jgi:hypothetical protein
LNFLMLPTLLSPSYCAPISFLFAILANFQDVSS